MSGVRVLLVNQYYPPDTSATAVIAGEVVAALRGAGHDVTVLAGRPSYAPTARRPWRLLSRRAEDGAMVERVGATAFDRGRLAGRLANYLSYLALAALRAPWIRADVVLAMTDPPLAAAVAALAASWRGVPLVYNIRDLHPDMAVAAGLLRPGLRAVGWEGLHRWVLRRAARVVVLGDDMRARIAAKGVAPERIAVVRDGAPADPPAPPAANPVRQALDAGTFVVLHAGNVGHAGAFGALLEAARILREERVTFAFVGGGPARERLRAASADLERVRWLEARPAAEVPQVMAAGDLQVVTVRRGLEGLVVPSKLYTALAAGRPVLAVASEGSDVARIVREADCGWVADPDDPAAIAAAVRAAIADPAERDRRAGRARVAASSFDRARLLAELVREVGSVL